MTISDISKLYIPKEFGSDDENEETDSINFVFRQLDNTTHTTWGASKFIIFFDENPDEIVKIPFNGVYTLDDEERIIGFDKYINTDYCSIEAKVYEDAVDYGLSQFFAETRFGGYTESGTPYYISEKVYTMWTYDRDKKDHYSEKSFKKATQTAESTELPAVWLAWAYEYYGDTAVQDLLDFILIEGIGDLHSDNIGYREDGSPVLLDYSNFLE